MASLKAIRRRIASVKSTQQITRAMKLISAARLRRAQEALADSLPYSQALARVADSLLTSEGISVAPVEGAQKRSLLVVIGSDRGLAGGYNSNVFRKAEQVMRDLAGNGLALELFAVGKKAVDHFTRTRVPIALSRVENLPRLATIALARDIATKMLADYRTGAIDETGIVYAHFQSAMTQHPTYDLLLPVKPPSDVGIADHSSVSVEISKTDAPKVDYLVEPSRAELVPVVLRGYLEASVYHALLEAEASEQAARMTAMDGATNNATKMISRYTLEMNRARQSQITRELMDIVGGAEALRGQA
ncbi:MAG TPA: ATP synthase F1 subunit gamma [Candidatus Binataceae bacterium]